MRKLFWALVVLFVFAPLPAASADTLSSTQIIHIRAVVPPMRTIIVNRQGVITEIDSNTAEDVSPQVYQDSVKDGNESPLTPQILTHYQDILATRNTSKTGVLYKLPASTKHVNQATVGVGGALRLALGHVALLFR